jgi:endo-1,4-beta-xylanase
MKRICFLFILLSHTVPAGTVNSSIMITPFKLYQKQYSNGGPGCEKARLSEKADFPVGVAVDVSKLIRDNEYRDLITSEFNSITAEQCMKASVLHPVKDNYNFQETDYLMEFCKKHNKRLHGHTLLWHKGNPKWIEKFKGDKHTWELMLQDHIQTIVGHCRGAVKSWDVVNEAFNDDGTLRDNIWLRNIGPDYIEKCFVYASSADPSAILFYNDFDLESRPEKLSAVLKYFGALKAKGIRIDGIGMQMHISINFPYLTDINLAAMQIEDKGFLVHYSEFDVSLVKTGKLWMLNKHLLKQQENRIKSIVSGYRKLNKNSRFGITFWGLSDADSWLTEKNGNDRPLLFDSRYRAKPAYCGFLEGLKE